MQTLKNRYRSLDARFALKKVFIDNQSQRKKLGIFFLFCFFSPPTDPSNFEKKSLFLKVIYIHLLGSPVLKLVVILLNVGAQ